jgi:hypothetical protein
MVPVRPESLGVGRHRVVGVIAGDHRPKPLNLVGQAGRLIEEAGFSARLDPLRGFDHWLPPTWMAVGAASHYLATCIHHRNEFFGGVTVSRFKLGRGCSARG